MDGSVVSSGRFTMPLLGVSATELAISAGRLGLAY